MSVRLSWLALVPCLLFISAANVQAGNPFEWLVRTNGLGWGEGYHANNGCVKTGALPRSYVPTMGGYDTTWPSYPSPDSNYQPNYQQSAPPYAVHNRQPAPPRQQPAENLPSVRKQLPPVPNTRPSPEARNYPQGQMGPRMSASLSPYATDRTAFRPTAVRP